MGTVTRERRKCYLEHCRYALYYFTACKDLLNLRSIFNGNILKKPYLFYLLNIYLFIKNEVLVSLKCKGKKYEYKSIKNKYYRIRKN